LYFLFLFFYFFFFFFFFFLFPFRFSLSMGEDGRCGDQLELALPPPAVDFPRFFFLFFFFFFFFTVLNRRGSYLRGLFKTNFSLFCVH